MVRTIRLVACAALLAGTASVFSASAAGAAPTLPPPLSMAAAGDSFTVGFATGAPDCNVFGPCPQHSWSTGTAVDSHYARLVALEPALSGNVQNAAVPGSPIAGLTSQMAAIAPNQPEYVTVLLGGGDICFGTTTAAQFASRFRAGMDTLFATSPDSRVLVASIWSFESMRIAVLTGNPSASWSFCGVFFNASAADRAVLTSRIVTYNAVLAAECATYANCLFDGGALFDHVWSPAEVSTVDNVHPSVVGQAMISQVLFDAGYQWEQPVIEPPDAAACRRGGWAGYADGNGRPFRNQGDCVSYVATGGRNPGAG